MPSAPTLQSLCLDLLMSDVCLNLDNAFALHDFGLTHTGGEDCR